MREGLVIRSLVFPIALTAGTHVVTLSLLVLTSPGNEIAIPKGSFDQELLSTLEQKGLKPLESTNVRKEVIDRRVKAGLHGRTVFSLGPLPEATLLESYLRRKSPESWQVNALVEPPRASEIPGAGRLIARLLSAIYALYGVVIGAGMIARDRDDGTLHAEFLLPIPRAAIGASRWLGASIALCASQLPALLLWDALIGIPNLPQTLGHGAAASLASTAIGIAFIGGAGVKAGFSARLAGGLTLNFSLYVLGRMIPGLAPFLPVASLGSSEAPWGPLAAALLMAGAAILLFQRVNGR